MKNYTCLVMIRNDLFYKIRPYLDENIKVVIKQGFNDLIQIHKNQIIHCGIIYCDKPNHINTQHIIQFKQKHSYIPLLIVLAEKWVETAHEYGRAGVEKVLHNSEINRLNTEVIRLINQHTIQITLKDIGINELNYSDNLNKALSILEKQYLTLFGVKEIADLLEINECTLSREFKKYNIPGPKRILMYFKVHHAVKLMNQNCLSKQQVALFSGFTDERRLSECLSRILIENNQI